MSYLVSRVKKLNNDLIMYIFSFLPIKFDYLSKKKIHEELVKYLVFIKWYKIYSESNNELYLDWLDDDITRWCNDDIPIIYGLTHKFSNIMNRVYPPPFNIYSYFNLKKKIQRIFFVLTLKEVRNLDLFLIDSMNKCFL